MTDIIRNKDKCGRNVNNIIIIIKLAILIYDFSYVVIWQVVCVSALT